ncbi:MAG: pilus assembly protein PilX [Acinetobacter sp.]
MNHQKGATLVMVLVILVLITFLGTIAIRSSLVGLKISTNSQVRSLLLENSNSALFNIEDPKQITRQLARDGMFSYFSAADNSDDELIFCYKAKESKFFTLNNASVISLDGSTTKLGVPGFCKVGQFATGRPAVQSQIYVKKNKDTSTPLSALPVGTSAGQSNVPQAMYNISVTVISILPSFAGASDSAIEGCFKKTSIKKDTNTQTVTECFEGLGIPSNTQYADYIVGGSPKLKS